MQSAFTINVGEKQSDGVRDVSVLYHGEVHFSTSFRNVKWAFLTRFPLSLLEQGWSPSSHHEDKFDVESMVSKVEGGKERSNSSCQDNGIGSLGGTMQEYLCVFHRDDPKNRRSHYTACQPSTICSAYNTVHPASVSHFALLNINPTSVVPALRGVFVHGTRQTSRWSASHTLRIDGVVFQPAADLWWMASPLSIRPVYVPMCAVRPMDLLPSTVAVMAPFPPSLQARDSSPASKYAFVNATVLTQFAACDGRMMAVALSGNEVCLATTIVLEHLDVLAWMWWPQRLAMPQLRVKGASVSVTVPESLSMGIGCLFLFDAARGELHALRTPNLHTGEGALTLLFTVLTNCPPVVLPCLRPGMVQPLLVCHQPAINEVALYHIPALLQDASPTNVIATMPLANAIPKNTVVDGVLYQDGSTVAFLVSARSEGGSKKDASAAAGASEHSGRRLCVLGFPSLLYEQHPLMHYIFEALETVLETDLVASLQCKLLRRAWESQRLGLDWDFSDGLIGLIADIVHTSMTGSSSKNNFCCDDDNDGGSTGCDTVKREVRLCDVVVDPIALTADFPYSGTKCNHESRRRRCSTIGAVSVTHLWTQHQCGLSVLVLHLLCESFKLQERLWPLLQPLAQLNLRLAQGLGWVHYVRYYSTCLCVPEDADILRQRAPGTAAGASVEFAGPSTHASFHRALPEHVLLSRFTFHAGSSAAAVASGAPPMLYTILQRVLRGKARVSGGWPAIKGINASSPLSIANRIFCMLVDCFDPPQGVQNLSDSWWLLLCRGLLRYAIDPRFVVSELCVGVAHPIERALSIARDHPEDAWDDDFNAVIGRLDRITRPTLTFSSNSNPAIDVVRAAEERAIGRQYSATLNDDDGVILRPDFPKHWGDSRLDAVQTMLNTAVPISLPAQVDGAGAMYTTLETFSRRAAALPVGRGMFTLCTQNFRVRDSVPIPRLNLEGRTSDGITIANNSLEVSGDNLLWPLFHNGCAAGLRLLPLPHFDGHEPPKQDQSITRHWVLYQTRNILCPATRSGLLLAAGLLGHLKVLQRTDIYSLLVSPQSQYSGREAVTIAVMIGLSCSFRGTCNSIVFNCLSMHVQSLTPATEDIEVSLDVQTAALVSIGILHQGSPDTFLVEMLLIQMSRLPSDEHFRDREGYALGAGFGLGLLLLGFGGSHGVPNVENRLLKFLEASRREAVPSACEGLETFNEINPDHGHFLTRGLLARNAKDSFKSYCTRVYEGDHFNIAVSSMAAAVALGLMYMQTNDVSMSSKVAPPDRLVGLQGVYPELCLLRSMMSSLITWGSIEPTREWVRKSVPSCLLRLANAPRRSGLAPAQVRYLMMNLGHCLAGAVLALGMRFAGSMDADAKAVVLAELNGFCSGNIGTTNSPITPIQRTNGAFRGCLSACAVALALIMAGTGDSQCLAVIQKLYHRANVKYGDHLAISMAMGLLFLGGGQLTLSNSIGSVAALVIAFFPVWPETASDNKHHLQTLRHLYCLAVVPRVIETVDILTNRSVPIPIRVIVHQGCLGQNEPSSIVKELWTPLPKGKENQAVRMVTPCLLPDPTTISRIEIRSAQHYNLTINNTDANSIGDGGLVVRVLEKQVTSSDPSKSTRSRGEQLVVDWIQRLFHDQVQRRPRCIEAAVILDNVNMLLASQESFFADYGPSKRDFSPDFVMNLRRTLERRYRGLLDRCGFLSPYHPLSQIVLKQQSVYSAAASLVKILNSAEGVFPRELEAVVNSLRSYTSTSDDECISISSTMQWLSQALHFHGFGSDTWLLPPLLTRYAPALQKKWQRFLALYQINQELLLCPQVLEDIVDCCIEYVD